MAVAERVREIMCPTCGHLLLKVRHGEIEIVCRRCKSRVTIRATADTVIVDLVPKASEA